MNRFPTSPSSNVALTPKQANIFAWGFQPEARFRDAVCGRRFGKTFLGAKEMRRAAKLAVKWGVSTDDEIWYAAPTFKQAKRVFWRRLKKAIPPNWRLGRPNESECHITLKTGHVMRIVGLDAYDNLRGSGLFFVLVDEWADCPYEAWEEVLRPMLSTCRYYVDGVERRGGHALRIGTPKGFNHCYDTYQAGQPGAVDNAGEPITDHRSWLYTSVQGGNVPDDEIEAARRSMDVRTFRQEYEASFENYQGVIYYCFDRRLNHTDETIKPDDELFVGMDFNVGKMAGIVHVMRDGLPRAVDEMVDVFDTPAIIEKMKERYVSHKITVYPDASGDNRKTTNASESDIALLKRAGFKVVVNPANPAVKDRINSMNAMLCNTYGERRFLVNTKKCPRYTQSLERQIWDEKGQPDKKAGFDHSNDAGGYFIVKHWPLKRQDATVTGLRA